MIAKADLKKSSIPEYAGNPLIEGLFDVLEPALFYESISSRKPPSREYILTFPRHVRKQYLDKIPPDFVVPNRRLYNVYELIHTSINSCYSSRNPAKISTKDDLHRNYRDFATQFKENYTSTYSKSSLLIGVPGVGKTTTINVAYSLFTKALQQEFNDESFIQIPIVKIECPKDGSIKDLCENFFIEVDEILGRKKYQIEYCKNRDTASDRVVAMSKLVVAHRIGVLIVDEIQHLSQAKSGGSEMMLNFFLNLDNTLHIPIIIVGTPEALDLFSEKQRLRRRFSAGAAMRFDRLPNDNEWSLIISQLFKYQYTDHLANSSINWNDVFYHHAVGIIDSAIKIFIASQKRAFEIEAECITPEIVSKVVEYGFWLEKDAFQEIREGKSEYHRSRDLFIPNNKENIRKDYHNINIRTILNAFEIPDNFSISLIEQYVLESPHLSDSEIALKIMSAFKKAHSKDETKLLKSGSPPKIKLQTNYIENDLRRCTTDDYEDLYRQLDELGVIVTLDKYMI